MCWAEPSKICPRTQQSIKSFSLRTRDTSSEDITLVFNSCSRGSARLHWALSFFSVTDTPSGEQANHEPLATRRPDNQQRSARQARQADGQILLFARCDPRVERAARSVACVWHLLEMQDDRTLRTVEGTERSGTPSSRGPST
jgi:hypothetical protein